MANAPWWRGTRGEWYVIAQFALFALIALAPLASFDGGAWPAPWGGLARAAGLLLGAAGGLLSLWGLLGLGARNLTALPHPTPEADLVETGPYGLARHPIYGGLLLAALGWGLLTHSGLALLLAAALLALFELKTRREEAQLLRRFPRYADYRRRVRKFIPFIY
jgi:protein-S-isoprenylcysteine O-methyltransferase Ste14